MRKQVTIISCIVAMLVVLPVLVPGKAFGQRDTIKLGAMPIVTFLPVFVGLEKKLFDQEGLNVKIEMTGGGQEVIPALAGGSLHMGNSGYTEFIAAISQGFDLVLVAPLNRTKVIKTERGAEDSSPILVLKDSGIESAKDLKGKVVLVNALKNINWVYFSEWLVMNGIDSEKDVRWVEMPFPRMGPVLRSKRADAGFFSEPFFTAEMLAGGMKAIGFPYIEVERGKPLVIAGYIGTRSWVTSNHRLVERFVRAFYKSIDYTNAHTEEWTAIAAKFINIKPELLQQMRHWDWNYPIDISSLNRHVDLAVKWGVIKSPVDISKFVYPTALKP